MNVNDKLLDLIENADRASAKKLMEEWIMVNSTSHFIENLLLPVFKAVEKKHLDVREPPLALAYMASSIIRDGIEMAINAQGTTLDDGLKGPVVFGNIKDDFHALGRDMIVSILRLKGWKVYDMGNNVPAIEMIEKAVENNAKVIGASAMMYDTAMNIKEISDELENRGLRNKIKLAAGGAIFRFKKNLINEVDGDGTCETATEVPELFDKLLSELERGQA